MRLLLTTYHQAFLSPAGGETELRQLAEIINDLGVRADLYGPQAKRLSFYDAVIHFSAHGGGEGLLREIDAAGTPIVLVPNFDFFAPDHSARAVVQRHFELADLVVVRTRVERELCVAGFAVEPDKVAVVPAGISPLFGTPAEQGLFGSAYGVDRFVLSVGQVRPEKQQLMAIEALADSALPLVIVGGFTDRAYYDACRAAAGGNVRFLPYVQANSEILRSGMQTCAAYLELGTDPPGFSALEAALAGAPLVLADHPWSRETFGDVPVFVADEPVAIRAGVDAAIAAPEARGSLVEEMRRNRVQPVPTRQLLELIEQLLLS